MRGSISIWFFSGALFFVYGVIITGQGIWELSHPPVPSARAFFPARAHLVGRIDGRCRACLHDSLLAAPYPIKNNPEYL